MMRLKPQSKFYVCMLLTLFSFFSKAEVLRWPQACPSGELTITNLKNTDIKTWIQKFDSNLIEETEVDLQASATVHQNIESENSAQRFSVLHFQPINSVKVEFKCSQNKILQTYPAHSFEGGLLTFRKSDLLKNEVWIQNLFSAENTIQIETLNRRFQTLSSETISLKSFEKIVFSKTNEASWTYLRLSGRERYTAFNINSSGSEGPAVINPQISSADLSATYFLVGPRSDLDNTQDSFVIKITDFAMIQKAREQILNPNLEKIVFARIQKGSLGFNRNWSKKEKSFWSWSVAEVTNFADLGSTTCNGTPQLVEDRVDDWVKDPERICFWGYRVKKELSPENIINGSLPSR